MVAPYRITFIPNQALGWSSSAPEDFRLKLAAIPTGTVLYTVALGKPASSNVFNEEFIGEVITEGPFVASKYGDKSLLFQHRRLPYKF